MLKNILFTQTHITQPITHQKKLRPTPTYWKQNLISSPNVLFINKTSHPFQNKKSANIFQRTIYFSGSVTEK